MPGQRVRIVDLPSGEWWSLKTRLTHGETKRLAELGPAVDPSMVGVVLARLTIDWGFAEASTPTAILRRDLSDLDAVISVVRDELVPALEALNTQGEAEHLFDGMVRGTLPPDYADVALLAATGWTWQELQETPSDIVHRMRVYLAVQSVAERGGELGVSDGDE